MSPLDGFLATLDQHLEHVRANAGERAKFAVVAANYGVPVASSGPLGEGEIRAVYRAIAARAWSGLDAIASGLPPDRVAAVRARLHRLEEVETRIVLERLAKQAQTPAASHLGVGAIFKNATASRSFWEELEWKERAFSSRCGSCGANQEKPRDFRCRYCGAALLEAGP